MNELTLLLFILAPCLCAGEQIKATVEILKANKTGSFGTLSLVQDYPSGNVTIAGTLSGVMPEGLHGFHVHTMGDLGDGCKNAKGHFNPEDKTHGGPNDIVRHVGDLGNVKADSSGKVTVNIKDHVISLNGPHSIIGRAMVLHEKRDDLGKGGNPESKKTGNAGSRIGCGVIGVASEGFKPQGNGSGTRTLSIAMIFVWLAAAVF